jgi:hypothetical protein
MDELKSQYLEVVNRIHLYEVPPITLEGLEKAIAQINKDLRLVNEYMTKYADTIVDIQIFKKGDNRSRILQTIGNTSRKLDMIKILHEFKLRELTILEIPIPNNNGYIGPLPSNNDRMEEYANV